VNRMWESGGGGEIVGMRQNRTGSRVLASDLAVQSWQFRNIG
jgi:hypothetical protein